MSYVVDTEAALREMMVVIDQEAGLRDTAGNFIHRPARVIDLRTGRIVYVSPAGAHPPETACGEPRLVRGDDGTCALELDPRAPEHARCLGRTIRGKALPRVQDLIEEKDLPVRVKDEIERRRIRAMLEAGFDVTKGR